MNTLEEIAADPSLSHWLKDALRAAYGQDPIAAIHDARRLLQLLGERYTQVVTRDLADIRMRATH
jgi:hypothetical protein